MGDDFKDSPTALVADVDCTAGGKDLCQKHDMGGYPTIKYGDPGDLKDYDGGRTFEDLKKFAEENLGPTCGPANLDLCSAANKKKIEGFMAMSPEKLEAKIDKIVKAVEEDIPVMKKTIGYLKSKTDL